jgi:hypothetical protein
VRGRRSFRRKQFCLSTLSLSSITMVPHVELSSVIKRDTKYHQCPCWGIQENPSPSKRRV